MLFEVADDDSEAAPAGVPTLELVELAPTCGANFDVLDGTCVVDGTMLDVLDRVIALLDVGDTSEGICVVDRSLEDVLNNEVELLGVGDALGGGELFGVNSGNELVALLDELVDSFDAKDEDKIVTEAGDNEDFEVDSTTGIMVSSPCADTVEA